MDSSQIFEITQSIKFLGINGGIPDKSGIVQRSLLPKSGIKYFSASRFENLDDFPNIQYAVRREQSTGFLVLRWLNRFIDVRGMKFL